MDLSTGPKRDPGRRTTSRRSLDRPDSADRRVDERRSAHVRRKLVAMFYAYSLERAADLVKTTKLLEPLVTLFTFIVSGVANGVAMGIAAGVAFTLALAVHETGHYVTAKRLGYRPEWWWAIPILGALMRMPKIRTRTDEAKIALGGPVYGFLFTLAATFAMLAVTAVPGGAGWKSLGSFLFTLSLVSVMFNLFNLTPILPLDGGRVTQGTDGAWPKAFRFIGFSALVLLTALLGQTTMFVVWILVIGELRLSLFGVTIDPRWRFILALGLLILLLGTLLRGVLSGALYGWMLVAELAYASVGAYITNGYYSRWKHPHRGWRPYELRGRKVAAVEGRVTRFKYLALLSAYVALYALIVDSVSRLR